MFSARIKCYFYTKRILGSLQWSDPKINFVFVLHKRLFVFVHAIRLCAVPELNFVRWRKRGS